MEAPLQSLLHRLTLNKKKVLKYLDMSKKLIYFTVTLKPYKMKTLATLLFVSLDIVFSIGVLLIGFGHPILGIGMIVGEAIFILKNK